MLYELHFPLGWVRAVCVPDSCQLYLTLSLYVFCSFFLFLPSFYTLSFHFYVCVSICLKGWDVTVNSYSSIWLQHSNIHTETHTDHLSKTEQSAVWVIVCVLE